MNDGWFDKGILHRALPRSNKYHPNRCFHLITKLYDNDSQYLSTNLSLCPFKSLHFAEIHCEIPDNVTLAKIHSEIFYSNLQFITCNISHTITMILQ